MTAIHESRPAGDVRPGRRLVVSGLIVLASLAVSGSASAMSQATGSHAFMQRGSSTSSPSATAQSSLGAHSLVTGLKGGSGSTIGPDGALYLTEGATGRVLRVDPATGKVTTFASGLPAQLIPLGGAMDIAFLGDTAYVLVTLVDAQFGGTSVDGV